MPRKVRLDEVGCRVDRGDRLDAEPHDRHGRERAGAAAHVEEPLPRLQLAEVGEQWRELA